MVIATYNVIGVMSGTSLDGIDLAYITFKFDGNWRFNINCAETVAYPKKWTKQLSNLIHCDLDELKQIDKDYTIYLSGVINAFIYKHKLKSITAICSHGHTALHQPERKLTYQIGNLPEISKLTNNVVICDFRSQDVALNGQGAPLVPIGDRMLFSEYDYCINLGGFANISSEADNCRIAHDICPVNIVMNPYANRLGFDYDENGAIAKSGTINKETLYLLNTLEYYNERPPKSLGLEWVNIHVFPVLEASKCSEADILRTFVEHIAIQISKGISSHSKVLFTGGGTYNSFLIDRIKNQTDFESVMSSNDLIDYKEALIFGLLGVLKLRNEANCLASVTGADYDHCSGVIYSP